jgi:hypothetical protein
VATLLVAIMPVQDILMSDALMLIDTTKIKIVMDAVL